jgi:hypothetical protein
MYAAAFIGNKIIDLAGWDQGPGAETSNLSISYDSQFQSVSYVGGTWGRQFWRPGTMATVSFDSRFSLLDGTRTDLYQRFISYFLLSLPSYFSNQQGSTLKLTQPYPTLMGTRQVETATGVGTVTGAGNVRVILTASGMDLNPLALDVPVTLGQTASQWMATVRHYFSTTPQVQMYFAVSGSGADMILTRRSPYAANDSTLNISIGGTGTTATGITAVPTSVNTTAGVAFSQMNEITFYDANVSVAASQIGTSVLLNTSVTGRLVAP